MGNIASGLVSAGLGFLTGGPVGAAAGYAGGSGMFNELMGGKKKSAGSLKNQNLAMQQELLAQVLPFIRDPGSAVSNFKAQSMADANRLASNLGGLLAEETGNPNALAATRLGMQNKATQATNQFQYDVMSPEGRAKAASAAFGMLGDLESQRLARQQMGLQFRQPTFLNQLFSAGAGALPWYLANQNQGSGSSGGSAPGFNFNMGSGLNVGTSNYGLGDNPLGFGGLGFRP